MLLSVCKNTILATCLSFASCSAAFALSPFQVYELAIQHDPVFLGAIKARDAGLENKNIARAGLLPRLTYRYDTGRNDTRSTNLDTLRGDTHQQNRYRSYNSTLDLQQPLLDYEAYANYRKGMAQTLLAESQFRSQNQQLLLRVLSHYLGALYARDQISNARLKQQSLQQQMHSNQQMYQRGEGTRTDILEAQSRYELAITEQIEAENELDAALRQLETLAGTQRIEAADLMPMSRDFEPFGLAPARFDSWQKLAISNNPELHAQRQSVETAKHDIERNRAGHLPKVNAYARIHDTQSASGNTFNQRYETNTIGLELSVPLFAGGGVSAATRQASRLMEQAQYQLDAHRQDTLIQLRRQYNACISGARKLRAYQKALQSAQALVEATRQSIIGGERVTLDELNAKQQLYSTRNELAKARYDYLMAWSQLHFYAGTLGAAELARVDEAFLPKQ